MGMLERQKHPLGDIMRMSAENAVLATYYRNNILHLFAHALAAGVRLREQCAHAHGGYSTPGVARVSVHFRGAVPALGRSGKSRAVADSLLETFARLNLLQGNADRSEWQRPAPTSLEAIRLSLLAQATIQTIERYYLAIALLLQAGSGAITHEALEERCHLMAQRMSVLYGLNSPEFFDKSLFRNFIDLLRRRNVIQMSRGREAAVRRAAARRRRRCPAGAVGANRHSILQVTLGQ